MTEVTKLLFGVDESDFSRASLQAVGELTAKDRRFHISVLHGVPDPRILFSKFAHLRKEDVEENMERMREEAKHCMDKAVEGLIQAGVEKENVAALLQEKCSDPAWSMVDFAEAQGFHAIGAARFGASTIGRHPIGSVSYRLACASETFPVWIVDHRVRSRNILLSLVGGPVGQRIIDHAARYFSHLTDSRFTLFHVIQPFSSKADGFAEFLTRCSSEKERLGLMENMNLQAKRAEQVLEEGKRKLMKAGIPEQNIQLKAEMQDQGVARDILAELEKGDYGILVAGRKESSTAKQFGLGSKAYKLLCAARAFMICLVN